MDRNQHQHRSLAVGRNAHLCRGRLTKLAPAGAHAKRSAAAAAAVAATNDREPGRRGARKRSEGTIYLATRRGSMLTNTRRRPLPAPGAALERLALHLAPRASSASMFVYLVQT